MNKPSAYILGTFLFGVIGSWLGSFASYVITYWGSHLVTLLALPEAWGPASRAFISTFQFGIAYAALPAMLTGLSAALLMHLTKGKLRVGVFALLCGAIGALLSYLIAGDQETFGAPAPAGAIAGTLTAILLFGLLRRWLVREPSTTGRNAKLMNHGS